jgi:O-antigen/teichoic acid export membrane protein
VIAEKQKKLYYIAMNSLSRMRLFLERHLKTDIAYFASSGFWLNLNSGFGAAVSLVLSILFANYLSKDVYGTYRYIISIAGIGSAFALTGMNVAVIRAVAQGWNGIFKKALVEQLKWCWPQFLFSFVVSAYYFIHGNSIYGFSFLFISVVAPLSGIANTYGSVLYGKKDFRRSAWYSIGSSAIYLIAMSSTVLFAGTSVVMLVVAFYGANFIANSFFCLRTYRLYSAEQSFVQSADQPKQDLYRAEDVNYAKHLSVMNIIGTLAAQLDNVLVYYFLGPISLALYSFAVIIPERIRVLFGFIAAAAFPKIAEKNLDSIKSNLSRKTWQLVFLALGISAVYIAIAPEFFKLFFPQYQSVVIYSQIFSLSLVAIATNISFTALQAHRQQRELYSVSIGVPVIKIIATVVGVYYFGIWGAIASKMLHNVLLLASTSYYLHRKS